MGLRIFAHVSICSETRGCTKPWLPCSTAVLGPLWAWRWLPTVPSLTPWRFNRNGINPQLGVSASGFALIYPFYLFFNSPLSLCWYCPSVITREPCVSPPMKTQYLFNMTFPIAEKKGSNLLKIQSIAKQIGYFEFTIFFLNVTKVRVEVMV